MKTFHCSETINYYYYYFLVLIRLEEQKKSGRVCTEQGEEESESFQFVAQILSELVDTIRIKFNPHLSGNEEKLKRLKVAATEKVNQLREMTTKQVRMNIEFRCEQLRIPFSHIGVYACAYADTHAKTFCTKKSYTG